MAPYDGAGSFSLPPGSIVSDGTTIDASDHNVPVTDIAAALSQVLLRSGVAPMTGDLNMGGFSVTNVGGTNPVRRYRDNIWTGANSFNGPGTTTIGNDVADPVIIKGTLVNSFSSLLLGGANASHWYTNLGLGTVVTYNVSTSGANVPLLSTSNTWTTTQRVNAGGGAVPVYLSRADATDGAGYFVEQVFLVGGDTVAGAISSRKIALTADTLYGTTSDARLKHARRPIDNSGTIIDQLEPIWFRWGDGTGLEDFGFDAQAVEAVLPGTSVPGKGEPGEKDFIPWTRQHGRLEAILVAEIQALRARVAALEAANGE